MYWQQIKMWISLYSNNLLLAVSSVIIMTLITIILKIVKRNQRLSVLNKIPGPKTKFLFGNALELMGSPTGVESVSCSENKEFFDTLYKKICVLPGGLSRVWIMQKPFLFIYGASGVEALLNNSRNLVKGSDYKQLHPWIGLGLLTSSGSKWKTRRKLLTPAFHFKILEEFIEVFNQQSQIFVNKLQKHSDGKPFDIFPFVTLLSLDIILESTMGIRVNAQDDPLSPYVKAVHDMSRIFMEKFYRPWLQYDLICNMTEWGKLEKESLNILHTFALNTIRERKKEYKRLKAEFSSQEKDEIIGKKKRHAFLDLLIEHLEEGNLITEDGIREEVETFMFEGHDTTASGITWAIYLFGLHPEIQDKVYEELVSIFGDSERPTTSEDIREMNYLECCIKESLRLFPPVPTFVRNLTEDLIIDGYVVPRGTDVCINAYCLHRDPKHFPDPLSFQPDRFLPEISAKRNPYAYVPFSAGPRNCIGQKFALMEEKIILTSFLRKYKVESLEAMEDLKPTANIVLRPLKEMNVKIFPRI